MTGVAFGKRPVDHLEDLGWIADDVWVVHLTDQEVRRLGRGWGLPPAPRATPGSLPMCPVTDSIGPAARWDSDCTERRATRPGRCPPELKMALYTARLREEEANALMLEDGLPMATEGGAACVGRPDLGKLQPGRSADLVARPGKLGGVPDSASALVLGPPRSVGHLLVGGPPLAASANSPLGDRAWAGCSSPSPTATGSGPEPAPRADEVNSGSPTAAGLPGARRG